MDTPPVFNCVSERNYSYIAFEWMENWWMAKWLTAKQNTMSRIDLYDSCFFFLLCGTYQTRAARGQIGRESDFVADDGTQTKSNRKRNWTHNTMQSVKWREKKKIEYSNCHACGSWFLSFFMTQHLSM